MNKNKYFLICIITFIVGMILFAYQKELIIFRTPMSNSTISENKKDTKIIKKNINLFFWHNSKWNNENIEIIWSNSKATNCFIITSNWLNLIDEEKIIDKKVSLQNALLSLNEQEIYISFDRNLFNEESPTFEKLMLIESLLKTLRENDIDIKKVYFLVHNQEMKDTHLDFSHAWPIQGFLN